MSLMARKTIGNPYGRRYCGYGMATRAKSAMFDPHPIQPTFTLNTYCRPISTHSQKRRTRNYSASIQKLFTGLAPEVLRMRLRQAADCNKVSLQRYLRVNKDAIISALSHLKGLITLIFPPSDDVPDISKWSLQLLCIVLRASECLTPTELHDVTFVEKCFRRHFRMRPQSASSHFGSARPKPKREWISVCSAIQRLVENVGDASLIKSVRNFICEVEMESRTLHAEREMKKRLFQTLMELIASHPDAKCKPESHSGKVITKKVAEIEKLRQNYAEINSRSLSASMVERKPKLPRPRIVSSAYSMSPYNCRLTRPSDIQKCTDKAPKSDGTQSPEVRHQLKSKVKRMLPDLPIVRQKRNEMLPRAARPNTAPGMKRKTPLRLGSEKQRPYSSSTVRRDGAEDDAWIHGNIILETRRRVRGRINTKTPKKDQVPKISNAVQKSDQTEKSTRGHPDATICLRTVRPCTAPALKRKATQSKRGTEKERPHSSRTTHRVDSEIDTRDHDIGTIGTGRRARKEVKTAIPKKDKKHSNVNTGNINSAKMSINDQLYKRVPCVNDASVNVSNNEKRRISDSCELSNTKHNRSTKLRATQDVVLNQDDMRKHTMADQTRMEYASKQKGHKYIPAKRQPEPSSTGKQQSTIKTNMSQAGAIPKRTIMHRSVNNKHTLNKDRIQSTCSKYDKVRSRRQVVSYNQLNQKSNTCLNGGPIKQMLTGSPRADIETYHKLERATPDTVTRSLKSTRTQSQAKTTAKRSTQRKTNIIKKVTKKPVVDNLDEQHNDVDSEMKRLAMEVLVHQNVRSVVHNTIFNTKDTVDQFFDFLYRQQIAKQFLRSPNGLPFMNWRSTTDKTEHFYFLHCLIFRHIEPERDASVVYVVEKVLTRLQCQHLRRPGSVTGGGSMFQGRKSLLHEALQYSRSNTIPSPQSKQPQSPGHRPDSQQTVTRSNTATAQNSKTKADVLERNPTSAKTRCLNDCWKCRQKDLAMEISINWDNTCITKLLLKEGVPYKMEHLVSAVKVNRLETVQDIVSFLREKREWAPEDERAKAALYEARRRRLESLASFLEQEGVRDERLAVQNVCVTCFL